jgi:hypothetical protein
MSEIADSEEDINTLVGFLKGCGVGEIFAEAVNARGPGLKDTSDALVVAGFAGEAEAVSRIRQRSPWSRYVSRLIATLQQAIRRAEIIDRLRLLPDPSRLLAEDRALIEADDEGVIWL